MLKSRTITCSIERPPEVVYDFASNPENLPRWVRSFCLSVRKSGDEWQMETPAGWVGIRFAPANDFGVLDHVVRLPDGQSILNPMRVVANANGSEVLFTLFQRPGMPGEQFAQDAAMVEADLQIFHLGPSSFCRRLIAANRHNQSGQNHVPP
jgi:hypothetical protein